jgi:hypothetical protein
VVYRLQNVDFLLTAHSEMDIPLYFRGEISSFLHKILKIFQHRLMSS